MEVITDEKKIIALYDKVDLVIDHSRQEVFNRCPREAYLGYELGLESIKDDSDALEFGKRLHKHLEVNDERVWDGYKEIGLHKRDHRTASKGKALVKLYQEKYREAENNRFERVLVEYAFGITYEVNGKKVLVKGKVDEILREKESGLLWVVDYKTTATYADESYFAPYYLGNQFEYYIPAVESLGDVGGVVINLFKVTKEATDDFDLMRKEIAIEEINNPRVNVNSEVVMNWMILKSFGKAEMFRQNTGACRRFNKVCDFYPICRYGMSEAIMKDYREKDKNDWHK